MATFGELIHGRKPEIAPFIPTDPIQQLQALLKGETGAFPQITQLSNLYQNYMLGALNQAIPGFTDLMKQGGENAAQTEKNALALQQGQLPPEDIAAMFRTSAAQNLGSGLLGSPAGNANALRNLGIGVLQGQQMGAQLAETGTNAAQRWAQIASGTILPPSQQLYSPEWFTNFMAQQHQAEQATRQMRYNVAAAPDPAWADRAKMFASIVGMATGAGGGLGNSIGQSYNSSFGGMGAGGAQNWMGNYGQGTGMQQANFGNPQNTYNPGFFSNFSQSYQSTDPNNTGRGFGGYLGNLFGGIFNAG